jgi:serine/threonine protein kinase
VSDPRWQRVKEVLADALMRPAEARPAFLDEACAADPELRREVESLLASETEADAFLSRGPALDPARAQALLEHGERTRPIGPYRILGVIARGGMGTVYRAVRDDDAFQKTVALKLVRGGAASEFVERRFRQERQILARLQHPNIAAIFDGGATDDGQPYLVMEHVEGRPITAYCDEHGLGTRQRLALFGPVCAAVQYAHQNLVVHRDLKPDNILVTAEGVPKLLDFGIAKLLAAGVDPDIAPTATMLPMMTPEYASPEQVRGQPITTASDVYSLGVVLYEMLTGRRPYVVRTESMEEIVRAVCGTEPQSPSTARRAASQPGTRSAVAVSDLRGDLDTIVLKALRKEPSRRYPSVQDLSEDIRRHLAGPARLGPERHVRIPRLEVRAPQPGGDGPGRAPPGERRLRCGRHRAADLGRPDPAGTRRAALPGRPPPGPVVPLRVPRRDRRHPGTTKARELVVERALEYLDGLAGEAAGDAGLQTELAAAYEKVGDVQGLPYTASLGDSAGAQRTFERAYAIRLELLRSQPHDPQRLAGACQAGTRIGRVLLAQGDARAALSRLRESAALVRGCLAWTGRRRDGRDTGHDAADPRRRAPAQRRHGRGGDGVSGADRGSADRGRGLCLRAEGPGLELRPAGAGAPAGKARSRPRCPCSRSPWSWPSRSRATRPPCSATAAP